MPNVQVSKRFIYSPGHDFHTWEQSCYEYIVFVMSQKSNAFTLLFCDITSIQRILAWTAFLNDGIHPIRRDIIYIHYIFEKKSQDAMLFQNVIARTYYKYTNVTD